jgi:stalled ribosome rescue protein Dom34
MPTSHDVPTYAVVWLDHQQARVLFLHKNDPRFDEEIVHSHGQKAHDRRHDQGRRHRDADHAFFATVADALERATNVWVVGPSTAKTEFSEYLASNRPAVNGRVRGVDTLDHPSDGQLAELGRRFFEKLEAPRQVFVRGA